MNLNSKIKRTQIYAKIIRKDGTVVELGKVSDSNWLWRLKNWFVNLFRRG